MSFVLNFFQSVPGIVGGISSGLTAISVLVGIISKVMEIIKKGRDVVGQSQAAIKSVWENTFRISAIIAAFSLVVLAGSVLYYVIINSPCCRTTSPAIATDTPKPTATATPTPIVSLVGIYFGTDDNHVYAVNDKGSSLWDPFNTGGHVDSSPILVGNTVYVGSQDAFFYGINARSGLQTCQFKMGDRTLSSPVYDKVTNLIFIGSQDHYVYAFNPDCTVKWKFPTSEAIDESAFVADGNVYIASKDNVIYALKAADGSKIWSQHKGASTPFVANSIVYVGSNDQRMYALNGATGDELWHFSAKDNFHSPVVANGIVYVGTDTNEAKLFALDAVTGTPKWSFQASSSIVSHPLIVNKVVYFGTTDTPGYAYAVAADTGTLVWKQQVSGGIETSLVYANGTVYFGSKDFCLYAVDAATGSLKQKFGTGGCVKANSEVNSTPLVVPAS